MKAYYRIDIRTTHVTSNWKHYLMCSMRHNYVTDYINIMMLTSMKYQLYVLSLTYFQLENLSNVFDEKCCKHNDLTSKKYLLCFFLKVVSLFIYSLVY